MPDERITTLGRVHTAPPFATEKGLSFFAKDSDGCWYYVNHAGEWHSCPPPFALPRGLVFIEADGTIRQPTTRDI